MAQDLPSLLPHFDTLREHGASVVLATIVATEGSSYRKAGARMLMDPDGRYHGILAGGCFEGDLAERARAVAREGRAECITYDMRGDDDLLWGLGSGCNGAVYLLLQPLSPDNGYQPFAAIADAVRSREAACLASVIEAPAGSGHVCGDSLLVTGTRVIGLGIAPGSRPAVEAAAREHLAKRRGRRSGQIEVEGVRLFIDAVEPPRRLLILGGGPDAVPLARLARELHWDVTVVDHRPAYVVDGRFPEGCRTVLTEPSALRETAALDGIDAAVVMSHLIATDQQYLAQLAHRPPPYIGLLGPAGRRDILLDGLEETARTAVRDRVRGPAGLDLGSRTPAGIALSVLAEIEARLSDRPAVPLDGKTSISGGASDASGAGHQARCRTDRSSSSPASTGLNSIEPSSIDIAAIRGRSSRFTRPVSDSVRGSPHSAWAWSLSCRIRAIAASARPADGCAA
jgi:xanthine/CO dehydrogenase XdhC/CoxF family maturation factor